MNRISIALTAALALSTPALAEGVRISLVGKDTATIHAEILKAARQACREESRNDPLFIPSAAELQDCVTRSVDVAVSSAGRPELTAFHAAKTVLIGSR